MGFKTLIGLIARLRAPSQSQKGLFTRHHKQIRDTKTLELATFLLGELEYLLIVQSSKSSLITLAKVAF